VTTKQEAEKTQKPVEVPLIQLTFGDGLVDGYEKANTEWRGRTEKALDILRNHGRFDEWADLVIPAKYVEDVFSGLLGGKK
jgi:hypothetical protein